MCSPSGGLASLFDSWLCCAHFPKGNVHGIYIGCWVGLCIRECLGCWRNGFNRPVLKHGPRSLTCTRVFGWQTHRRNESEGKFGLLRWERCPRVACIIDRSRDLSKDLSKSVPAGTRKMVNYARLGWSQRKLWWKLVGVLTCKSILKGGYRGERLIEPSSSWFPPKFPPG